MPPVVTAHALVPLLQNSVAGDGHGCSVPLTAIIGGYDTCHSTAADGYLVQRPSARRAGVSYYVKAP